MRRFRFFGLLFLFYGSGASGLIYQVLWLRQLSLVFGVTVYAASTVLAAFMTGLAVGSWISGGLSSRITRPVSAFGVIEILIGLSALATPAALGTATTVYEITYRSWPDAWVVVTLARFLCSFVVLLVPTILMGMTLPLLSRSSMVHGLEVGSRVSALYAANTAGALTGVILAGFYLIGALGMQRTFLFAAMVNGAVGFLALWLARGLDRQGVADVAPVGGAPRSPNVRTHRALVAIVMISGGASLALEIVWFRALLQFLPATTYAFTTMLASVLAGIAFGGAISARILARAGDWHGFLVRVLFATGIVVAASFSALTWSYAGWRVTAPQMAVGAILPAALLMGMAFPIALRLGTLTAPYNTTTGLGNARAIGRLYALNVAGAIVGAVAGGFVFLPWLGTRGSVAALASLYMISGVMLSAAYSTANRLAARAAIPSVLFIAAVLSLPDPVTMAIARRRGVGHQEIWRYEGVQGIASVQTSPTGRTLYHDGTGMAADNQELVRLHRTIGHLPMILHPSPTKVLVIGLGGGTTAGAMSLHPNARVQVVELSDGVRLAAPLFAHVNYGALNRPNVRLRVDDGRNFLSLTEEQFDVITADTIHPTYAGAGNLYAREYFALVRRALSPNGLVLQWIGQRPEEHYKAILRTFLSVFPDATLWFDGELLVGSLQPLRADVTSIEQRLADPNLRAPLAAVGIDSVEVLFDWYKAGPAELHRFVGTGPILTDDRPLLEYLQSIRRGADLPDLSEMTRKASDVFGGSSPTIPQLGREPQ